MLKSGLCCTHDKQPGNDGDKPRLCFRVIQLFACGGAAF